MNERHIDRNLVSALTLMIPDIPHCDYAEKHAAKN